MTLCRVVIASCALAACGAPVGEEDAGKDGGVRDAGLARPDGGADAGRDAGGFDAGVPDAGVRDAGPNHAPVVNPDILINRSTVFAGQIAEVALGATDEDGDRLSFTWSGPGRFFENGNPSAQRWFSDERDVSGSLLYLKMSSTQPAGCGDGMPAMSMAVPASPLQHIVTVGSWIRAGALND